MQIADDIGISRDTVSRLCKELECNDLIIKRKNKQSPYHLTPKMYGDPRVASFLFQREAVDRIREGDIWISDNSRFCNIDYCKTIMNSIYYPQKIIIDAIFNPKKYNKYNYRTQEEFEHLTLFEFGNRIGVLILYTILQSIRPKEKKENDLKIAKEKMPLKGKDKDGAGKSWIESISIDRIFQEFFRLPMIRESLMASTRQQQQTDSSQASLSFEMKEQAFDRLENMFSSIYPDFYKKLESIRKNVVNNKLNKIYDEKRAYLQKIEQDRKHTKCNGTLLQEIKTNVEGKKVQQCNKCHRWIEVKN